MIEYRGIRKRTKEYRELEHFAEFLSDLKDQFFLCKNVTESIFRAAERMPGSLRKRLEEVCFLLEEDTAETELSEEQFLGYMKYLRLFFVQCRSAVQYGSGKNSAESVFVRNMTELRRDVLNECYQRAQAKYLFAGMGVVAVVPLIFLPFIRWFGSETMEELKAFYDGETGTLIVTLFGIITFCCYFVLYLIRQTDKRLYQRPKILNLFFAWDGFQRVAALFKGSRLEKKGAERLEAAGIEANGMQYWTVCTVIGVGMSSLLLFLIRNGTFSEKMCGFLFGICFGFAIGMLFYRYLKYLRRLGASGEVLGLQSGILLLMDVPNITIIQLLDVLEHCGELFQKKLMRCVDRYTAEDVDALKKMFEEEEEPSFKQLAGRILASERIGLKAAFSEIAADRQFFREQLKFDMEQERRKKAANAQVVAFMPMMFLLFAYLILPFLNVSLGQMRDIFKEMEQIRYF